jgi:hypothetical protein
MCHALLMVKYRTGQPEQIKVESAEELASRLEKLQSLDETLEVRVFVSTGKHVKRSTWEIVP